MPDSTGKLSKKEKLTIIDNFEHRGWPPFKCPICRSDEWTVGDHLVQPLAVGCYNQVLFKGAAYPQVMLISKQCGYTMFINAVMAGIVRPDGA